MASGRGNGSPTIRDVARLAAVSPQTVSRVLNTPELVKPFTRDRVLDSISQLGYRRNPVAWGLATQRSGAIGVIDSGSGILGQGLLLTAIEVAAREKGHSPRVTAIGPGSSTSMRRAYQFLQDEMVEGFIILGNTTLEVREALSFSRGAPIVLAASDETAFGRVSTVAADQALGARLMIDHLRTRGERIGMISGPRGWLDAESRLQVWQRDAPRSSPELLRFGDWSAESGYAAMNQLLEVGVDSVFSANDQMALGAVWACVSAGLRVPGDIAVGGYDDAPGAGFFNPPLTTVRQPFREVGTEAVNLLDELIRGEPARSVVLPTELIVRESA